MIDEQCTQRMSWAKIGRWLVVSGLSAGFGDLVGDQFVIKNPVKAKGVKF